MPALAELAIERAVLEEPVQGASAVASSPGGGTWPQPLVYHPSS